MSSTQLLFLKPLLTRAQVTLLLNRGLEWISASLRRLSFPSIPCASDQVFWIPFPLCKPQPSTSFPLNRRNYFLFLRDPWSQNQGTLNLLSLWHTIYFLCSSIFCSLLSLVSESHHLSESSPSILLWIPWITVFRWGTRQQGIFCYLPAPLPPLASCLNLSSSLSSFRSS